MTCFDESEVEQAVGGALIFLREALGVRSFGFTVAYGLGHMLMCLFFGSLLI